MTEDYDLFVIGAGSGGVRAARVAAQHGARVAIAEESRLGGTCVNVGCVPKKLLVYGSHFAEDFRDALGFGWSPGTSRFEWKKLIEAKDREIERLNAVYGRLLADAGVDLWKGRARMVDAHTIEVGQRTASARHVLIATGGHPFLPDVPGAELAITSNEAFFLDALPGKAVIVGGGYIALEFACIFHSLGSDITVVHRGEEILRGFDHDIRSTVHHQLVAKGIQIHLEDTVERIMRGSGSLEVSFDSGGGRDCDLVMFATGRRPNTRGMGLEEVGVKLGDDGSVVVDDAGQSSIEHIHAVGDVTNRINLTPVAIAEGHAVADTLFGPHPRVADRDDVPTAVFTQPAIATVGLTELQARERLDDVHVYRTHFKHMKHTLSGRDETTMMKLVVDGRSDRVVGCHMVGAEAGEIVQGLAVAMKAGATKAHFDATIGIHPTAAEEFVTLRERVDPQG